GCPATEPVAGNRGSRCNGSAHPDLSPCHRRFLRPLTAPSPRTSSARRPPIRGAAAARQEPAFSLAPRLYSLSQGGTSPHSAADAAPNIEINSIGLGRLRAAPL